MSVEAVLRKLCDHNKDVLGCIASSQDKVFQRLPEMYDLIDADQIREHAENVFTLMDGLEPGEGAFERMFLEFQDHSVAARRLDDGVLVIIANPIARAEFRKTEVGINLFLKPLRNALSTAEVAESVAPPPDQPAVSEQPASDAPKRKKRMYRGVEY